MQRKRRHDLAQLMTRLPADQKLWLEQQAGDNCTSMNAEIIRAIRLRMDNERQPEKAVG